MQNFQIYVKIPQDNQYLHFDFSTSALFFISLGSIFLFVFVYFLPLGKQVWSIWKKKKKWPTVAKLFSKCIHTCLEAFYNLFRLSLQMVLVNFFPQAFIKGYLLLCRFSNATHYCLYLSIPIMFFITVFKNGPPTILTRHSEISWFKQGYWPFSL